MNKYTNLLKKTAIVALFIFCNNLNKIYGMEGVSVKNSIEKKQETQEELKQNQILESLNKIFENQLEGLLLNNGILENAIREQKDLVLNFCISFYKFENLFENFYKKLIENCLIPDLFVSIKTFILFKKKMKKDTIDNHELIVFINQTIYELINKYFTFFTQTKNCLENIETSIEKKQLENHRVKNYFYLLLLNINNNLLILILNNLQKKAIIIQEINKQKQNIIEIIKTFLNDLINNLNNTEEMLGMLYDCKNKNSIFNKFIDRNNINTFNIFKKIETVCLENINDIINNINNQISQQ